MMSKMKKIKNAISQRSADIAVFALGYVGAKILESTVRSNFEYTEDFVNRSFDKYERKGGLLTKGEYNQVIRIKPKQKMREKIGQKYEVDARTINSLYLDEMICILRNREGEKKPFFDEVHEMIAKIATIKGVPQDEREIREMHEEATLICESLRT